MQRIAEEERKRAEEENAAEAKRGPLTASTHALFVDQQLTELEILRNFYGDLRGTWIETERSTTLIPFSEPVSTAAHHASTQPHY